MYESETDFLEAPASQDMNRPKDKAVHHCGHSLCQQATPRSGQTDPSLWLTVPLSHVTVE